MSFHGHIKIVIGKKDKRGLRPGSVMFSDWHLYVLRQSQSAKRPDEIQWLTWMRVL